MTRILIVDDQELVRTGFRLICERAGFDVVGEAGDGLAAVEGAQEFHPDVVLMDLRMPRLDGIEATRRIMALPKSAIRVLVLTTFDLDENVFAAVRAGACGFLLKDAPPADLIHAIETVARGDAMLAPAITRRLLERFAEAAPMREITGITERERSILLLIGRGLSNAEIAAQLFLSVATVKSYVSRLLTKLDLRDRVQLAVLAYESGLVRPGQD